MSQGSFQRQLMVTLTLSLLGLALTIALVTSWGMQSQLRALAINYGADLTADLGEKHAFALMATEQHPVIEQAVTSIGTFPGVAYAALLTSDFTIHGTYGESSDGSLVDSLKDDIKRASLIYEDNDRWYFMAPVQNLSDSEPFLDEITSKTADPTIGYVIVAWHKTLLSDVENLVYLICGGGTLLAVFVLWGLLGWRVGQLTRPLSDLVAVMKKARTGDDDGPIHATPAGPQEMQEIAIAFNQLYEKLEKHKQALESEVAIRTKDLQQARDDALTAARHKSEFLATVTHEMRTPLHNVNYHTELARDELRFANQVDVMRVDNYLQVVQTKGGELLRLINRFLDFARSEAGKDDVRLTTVNLKEMVAQLVEAVRPLAEFNGNRLSSYCEGIRTLLIDRDKLEQILSNLLTNACRFTHNGVILFQVQCMRNMLNIKVIDTGIGISPQQIPYIFEPFTQVDMSDSRRYGGTGLGLAIAQSYCRLMKGSITVKSEIDKGSEFTVVIPLPVQHPDNATPTPVAVMDGVGLLPSDMGVDQNVT